MRLLITENDLLVRRWLTSEAAHHGVHLLFADGEDALDRISAEQPDCVFLDASSCPLDDQPLWDRLAARPDTSHIPVLVYSSSTHWQVIAQLAGAEANGYLPRPFTTETLVDAARRAANAVTH